MTLRLVHGDAPIHLVMVVVVVVVGGTLMMRRVACLRGEVVHPKEGEGVEVRVVLSNINPQVPH